MAREPAYCAEVPLPLGFVDDLAELLGCWGSHQGGCERSDPRVCAVWANDLVGRTVPIGTSAAPGEVPSVRIPMDYKGRRRPQGVGFPFESLQANMDIERVLRCAHYTVRAVVLPIS
jgi:hypothetical protein